MATIEVTTVELLALKKLALVNGALVRSLDSPAAKRETETLLRALMDVIARADLENNLEKRPHL